MQPGRWAGAVVLALLAAGEARAIGLQYEVTDLGTLGGNTIPRGINASGAVVGEAPEAGPGGTYHAFYASGAPNSLTVLPFGGTFSRATGINDAGAIVGYAQLSDGYHGFVYQNGSLQDLGALGPQQNFAQAINAAGTIVGSSYVFSTSQARNFNQAYSVAPPYTNGLTDLGQPGVNSEAAAISNSGLIAGSMDAAGGATHAFFLDAGGMHDLGTLGGVNSAAFGVNDAGEVVGWSQVASGTYDGFRWTAAGGMTDLGVLDPGSTIAWGINAAGAIVGTSGGVGYLDEPGLGMIDLNTAVGVVGSGWAIGAATAINDSGQIAVVGDGVANGLSGIHALLLTPVPEPASAALLFLAAGALAARRRRS
jgi:probable HAF family extracellular repeat protein